MSKFLLLALLLVVACEGEKKPKKGIGRETTTAPVLVEGKDKNNLISICNALSDKERKLDILSASSVYSFGYAQKPCSEEVLPDLKLVEARIDKDTHTFKSEASFGFSGVETLSKGVMSEICKDLNLDYGNFGGQYGDVSRPILKGSSGYTFTTIKKDGARCESNKDQICIRFSRGSIKKNLLVIDTDEWIKFNITGDRKGFFVERDLETSISCGGDQRFIMRAVLN